MDECHLIKTILNINKTMNQHTLLLTGTIFPSTGIKKFNYKNSLDPQKRLKEYEDSIKYYITESFFDKIVFCENSNYSCEGWKHKMYKFAKENGKELEILQFQGNVEKTLELNYSYGEGECIDYAFDNSLFLKKSTNWFKITGRYIIKNINKIIETSDKYDNLLFKRLRPLGYFAIDTSVFKVSNDVYKKYLYNANIDITKENKKGIENVFYDRLRNKKICFGKLKVLPKKDGYWDSGFYEKWYHHVLLFLGLWNEGTLFSKIVDCVIYKNQLMIGFIKKFLKIFNFKTF